MEMVRKNQPELEHQLRRDRGDLIQDIRMLDTLEPAKAEALVMRELELVVEEVKARGKWVEPLLDWLERGMSALEPDVPSRLLLLVRRFVERRRLTLWIEAKRDAEKRRRLALWIEARRDAEIQAGMPWSSDKKGKMKFKAAEPESEVDLFSDKRRRRSDEPLTAAVPAPPVEPEAEPGDPDDQAFYFLLEGEQAGASSMRAHSAATLHFRYDVPPQQVLAKLDGTPLDAARTADVDIALHATPRGNITIEGERRQVAHMRGGELTEPVRFALRAGAADPEAASGVHVEFVVKGETVHQTLLPIGVEPADAKGIAPPGAANEAAAFVSSRLLDDAGSIPRPPKHRLKMSVTVDGSGLRMELQHLIDGEDERRLSAVARKIDPATLANGLSQALGPLAQSYSGAAWESFDGSMPEGDAARPVKVALGRAMECAAAAGSRLNASLRDDAGIANLLDYIEHNVPDGALLTVSTDSVFLPWELLTPQHWSLAMTEAQKRNNPAPDPARFWGARFAIETVLDGAAAIGELKRAHLQAPARVSVNVNPDISMTGLGAEAQPLQVQRTWATTLARRGLLDRINDECQPMREVLQDGSHHASLVYLYCHGRAASPFGGADELLVLDDDCNLAPPDLIGDEPYAAAPIVFLNACQSGAHSPLAYSNFLKEFSRRGAIGLIATSHSVPITFAAHFGAEVVDRYLERKGSLASALLALRREHVAGRGNPVPLLYTLQCQLTFPS